MDDVPETIGANDVTKESGLQEPHVPGPGKDEQPETPPQHPTGGGGEGTDARPSRGTKV